MPPRTVPMAFDSSALILFLNGALPEKAVQHLTQSVESNKAFISAVVRAEVLAWGGHSIASLEAAMALLDVCNLLPVDAAVADKAASIRRETAAYLCAHNAHKRNLYEHPCPRPPQYAQQQAPH